MQIHRDVKNVFWEYLDDREIKCKIIQIPKGKFHVLIFTFDKID